MVVVDNSCLSSLRFIQLIDILPFFFDNIVISNAVFSEYQAKWITNLPDFITIQTIEIPFENILKKYPSLENFGMGDIHSFYLALISEDLLITDDLRLRKFALLNGVETVGTLRLLKSGYKEGFFETKELYLEKLENFSSDVYLKDELIEWARDV